MSKQRQVASWHRAFLMLLTGVCAAWLQGCAIKPQAQYKVYFCNMESTMVSEIRINYGGALWTIPPLPAPAKGGDERCLGGYAITTMEVLPEAMALKWVLGGRRYEVGVPIKSTLNGLYPTGGIQVVFQNNRVDVFEYVYPTNNHLMRLRIYPPVAPKLVPTPKSPIRATGLHEYRATKNDLTVLPQAVNVIQQGKSSEETYPCIAQRERAITDSSFITIYRIAKPRSSLMNIVKRITPHPLPVF